MTSTTLLKFLEDWEALQDCVPWMEVVELDMLKNMHCRMSSLVATSRFHKQRTRPVRAPSRQWPPLPVEIHRYIFELSMPPPLSDGIPYPREDDPVRLSLVSKRWQAITLATPLIWSRITAGNYKDSSFKISRARLWLLRAKRVPVTIKLNF